MLKPKKELDTNEIEKAIATIYHNLECLEEAKEWADTYHKEFANDYKAEKMRLRKLLSFYKKLLKEVE